MSGFVTREEYIALLDQIHTLNERFDQLAHEGERMAHLLNDLAKNQSDLAKNQQKDAELHAAHDRHIQDLYAGGIALRNAYVELVGLNKTEKEIQ